MISWAFWAFLLATTLFRVVYVESGVVDIAPDEAHYWEWSRHLDLSYYSKGPLVAYVIYLGTRLFGDTPLGVRIGAIVISLLTAWLLFVFVRELARDDGRTGLYTVIGLQAVPLFAAGSILMTIDPPFLLFWVLTMICLWRALHSGASGYWLLAGAAVGLGLLAKYTMVFVLPSLLLYFLLAPGSRHWLRRREPYLACLVALGVFSQVLIWNAQHDWVSFRHTASRAPGVGINLARVAEFLGGQFFLLTPLIACAIGYGLWRGWREGFIEGREPARFLMSFALPVFGFFLLLSFRSKVQANWPAAAYVPAALLAVLALRHRWAQLGRRGRRWLGSAVAAALLLGFGVTAVAHETELLSGVGLALPPEYDPTVRLKGWREMGNVVSRVKREMETRNRVFLFSDRYQVTSELAFYVEGQPRAYNVNLGRRLNQYDLWGGAEGLRGWDAIYVTEGERQLTEPVLRAFERTSGPELVRVQRGDRIIRTFSVFRCYGFKEFPPPPGKTSY